MTEAIGEDVANMLIGQAVVHHPPALAAGDNIAVAQNSQLMAQRRLADTEEDREVADAELGIREAQRVEDTSTCRVGQHAEGGGHPVSTGVVEEPTQERGDVLGMDALDLAPLGRENV